MNDPAAPIPSPVDISRPARSRRHRVRTPAVHQMEAVECGAAALGTILQYHGKYVPLEELRVACGVSRDGSRASNVRRAGERYGLEARAFRKDLAGFWNLRMPVIVFWNFNHFLVVEGFRKDRVYLNDPAAGPRTVTIEEFDRSYTGVVLTFEPTANFTRGPGKPGIISGLRSRLKTSGKALAFIFLCTALLLLPGLMTPWFSRVFVDHFLSGSPTGQLGSLLALMGIVLALLASGQWLLGLCLLRLETRLALSGVSRFMKHLLHLPVVFYQQRSPGEIVTRASLSDRIAALLSGDLARAAFGLSTMGFYVVLMGLINVPMAVISVGFAAASLGTMKMLSRRRVELGKASQQDVGRWMGATMTGLRLIDILKADGGEEDFFSRWAGYQARMVNGLQPVMLMAQSLMVAPVFFQLLSAAVTLGYGGYLILEGRLTIGLLVAFQLLSAAFLQPVNDLVSLGDHLQEVESGMARVDDVFRHPEDPEITGRPVFGSAETPKRVKLSGAVEFRDVTFGYSRLGEPLFQNFNLTIRPGERVALVGPTGCGKSTLARLLVGLHQPWSGEILLDGVPRMSIPRDVFIQSVAMVDQDIFLFDETVRGNTTLWDLTVPEKNIIDAAKDACIHEEIAARPGAYDNRVEEGGRNFSGGQCQRLEIARALVNNPALLILDEATSALDAVTEKRIDDNLRRRGCTCLIIAHRLSTIRDTDQIIVLDRGRTVQQGTHAELVSAPGLYSLLIEN